jgi:UTP--glucose-1-phosphate uridylyltransferase
MGLGVIIDDHRPVSGPLVAWIENPGSLRATTIMKVRKAVIPVAGLGTRLLPATKAIPKEMLPLADKPTIQYIVEEAVAAGIEHIILITSRGKRAIEDHFDTVPELEQALERKGDYETLEMIRRIADMAQLSFTRQPSPRGLGHAILQAKDLVGNEPFGVLLGDDLVDAPVPCLRQLMNVYEDCGASVLAVMPVEERAVSLYGIVDVEPASDRLRRVRGMVEKPAPADAPSNLAIIGRYVLTPRVFELLEQTQPDVRNEIELTDALHMLLRYEPIVAAEFTGVRYDTGNKVGLLTTSIAFALRRPDLAPGLKAYLRSLDLSS